MKIKNYLLFLMLFVFACKEKTSSDNRSNRAEIIQSTSNLAILNNESRSDSVLIALQKAIADNPYSNQYDTVLSGGYAISFGHNRVDQWLLYKKGETVLDTITICSLGLPYKNLGYLLSDFENCFLFASSFGSGNPSYIMLLDKSNLENLIPEGSAFIAVDKSSQIFLYSKVDVPSDSDSMTLFDIKSRKEEHFPFPKEIFGEPEILNRIHLVNADVKGFTIDIDYNEYKSKKQLSYKR